MPHGEKQVPLDVPWIAAMQHRPDPNRIGSLQVPSPGYFEPRTAAGRTLPTDYETAEFRQPGPSPQAPQLEPSYYDVPMLKPSVWKWEIASYFFLGGLSAAAYVLARLADRFGGKRYKDLTATGVTVAFATALPCAPLLIHDLGDPKRFHHMLRVWKPSTPMNVGTWTLVAYEAMVGAEILRQMLRSRSRPRTLRWHRILTKLEAAHDAAGIPFAITLAGYTGVLLSCTANPMWCRNRWLGPLFSASAISTGAEAVSLALLLKGGSPESHRALQTIDTVVHVAEGITLAGYLRQAGPRARPLTHGSMKKHLRFSVGGLIASEVIKRLPLPRRLKKITAGAAALIGLAAGFSMRWGMIYGGKEAGADPHLARLNSRPQAQPRLGTLGPAGGRLSTQTPERTAPLPSRQGPPPLHTGEVLRQAGVDHG